MSLISEFKQFAVKGNVIDLAVAVVIGAAFGAIVTSLVNDIVMPPIGMATGGVDFTDLKLQLSDPVMEGNRVVKEGASINYGNFIQTVVNFLIIALAIFSMVKAINAMKRKEEAAPATPTPSKEELLLTEIRDLLRDRKTPLS
ncbi:large-conductance mechanosensitive channel protein MscL [Adhaeribacter rhizoryzae]|uniref:Large-conductance mechanosensitive channel n=1 Tax=Adhaeribacter rhizoryzae TaxID=2607907 RepID=A0A5M6D984_9BACT|nr:large-conductance mechanosensitive channel protein MscL [Adhaeribacter rhizoryzae]KAA5544071.1 large-conductance mechanosensitive channel protein MscL [Adhaeribacter rhizoryzae]